MATPVDDFLAKTTHVHHEDTGIGEKFQDKITV